MEYTDRGDLYQKIVQFKKCGCLIEEADVFSIYSNGKRLKSFT